MLLVASSSAIDVLLTCSYGGRVAWWLSRDLWAWCCQSLALGMAVSYSMTVWSACRLFAVVDDSTHGHGWLFARANTCWRERS